MNISQYMARACEYSAISDIGVGGFSENQCRAALEYTKFVFGRGSVPNPAEQRSPRLPSWFKGTYFYGGGEGRGKRRKGMGREGQRRGGEGKGKREGRGGTAPLTQIPRSAPENVHYSVSKASFH